MSTLSNALAGRTDLFVPAFEVWIGERKLDRQIIRDVMEVSFNDSLDELGGFSLTLELYACDDFFEDFPVAKCVAVRASAEILQDPFQPAPLS